MAIPLHPGLEDVGDCFSQDSDILYSSSNAMIPAQSVRPCVLQNDEHPLPASPLIRTTGDAFDRPLTWLPILCFINCFSRCPAPVSTPDLIGYSVISSPSPKVQWQAAEMTTLLVATRGAPLGYLRDASKQRTNIKHPHVTIAKITPSGEYPKAFTDIIILRSPRDSKMSM